MTMASSEPAIGRIRSAIDELQQCREKKTKLNNQLLSAIENLELYIGTLDKKIEQANILKTRKSEELNNAHRESLKKLHEVSKDIPLKFQKVCHDIKEYEKSKLRLNLLEN
ncbi:MAG: hypothetical protein MHMPM18_001249 [Marteilia pararefringens]